MADAYKRDKRQREIAKKKKREEKLRRRKERKLAEKEGEGDGGVLEDDPDAPLDNPATDEGPETDAADSADELEPPTDEPPKPIGES